MSFIQTEHEHIYKTKYEISKCLGDSWRKTLANIQKIILKNMPIFKRLKKLHIKIQEIL